MSDDLNPFYGQEADSASEPGSGTATPAAPAESAGEPTPHANPFYAQAPPGEQDDDAAFTSEISTNPMLQGDGKEINPFHQQPDDDADPSTPGADVPEPGQAGLSRLDSLSPSKPVNPFHEADLASKSESDGWDAEHGITPSAGHRSIKFEKRSSVMGTVRYVLPFEVPSTPQLCLKLAKHTFSLATIVFILYMTCLKHLVVHSSGAHKVLFYIYAIAFPLGSMLCFITSCREYICREFVYYQFFQVGYLVDYTDFRALTSYYFWLIVLSLAIAIAGLVVLQDEGDSDRRHEMRHLDHIIVLAVLLKALLLQRLVSMMSVKEHLVTLNQYLERDARQGSQEESLLNLSDFKLVSEKDLRVTIAHLYRQYKQERREYAKQLHEVMRKEKKGAPPQGGAVSKAADDTEHKRVNLQLKEWDANFGQQHLQLDHIARKALNAGISSPSQKAREGPSNRVLAGMEVFFGVDFWAGTLVEGFRWDAASSLVTDFARKIRVTWLLCLLCTLGLEFYGFFATKALD